MPVKGWRLDPMWVMAQQDKVDRREAMQRRRMQYEAVKVAIASSALAHILEGHEPETPGVDHSAPNPKSKLN